MEHGRDRYGAVGTVVEWNESQLVERVDDGTEERWVLLPGYEEKCLALYQAVQNKGIKLEDDTDGGKIVEKGILTLTREFMIQFMRDKADKKAQEAATKSEAKEELEDKAKEFEDKAQEQQKVVKSLLEQTQAAKPEDKEKLAQEAKEAAKVLEDYRKSMRQLVDQAAQVAREAKAAEQEALDSEKKAEKGTAKLEKRRGETDNGRDLPWQALGENAAAQATVKDLAGALYASWPSTPTPRTCCTPCSRRTARMPPTSSRGRCRRSA